MLKKGLKIDKNLGVSMFFDFSIDLHVIKLKINN